MKNDNNLTLFERYLNKEIGIEFKACLYFFAILFFYCVNRMINGDYSAEILHMAEMIFGCYIMGYIQVFLFNNFDESDKMGPLEWTGLGICTLLYCLVSYFGGWFDKKLSVTLCFAAYVIFTYICAYLIYKFKRKVDDKILNKELELFKENHKKVNDNGE